MNDRWIPFAYAKPAPGYLVDIFGEDSKGVKRRICDAYWSYISGSWRKQMQGVLRTFSIEGFNATHWRYRPDDPE